MASITLTGTLLDPTGEVAVGDQIRFTHRTTTGETIQFARSVLIIPPNGLYNITLEFGLIFVEYLDVKDVHYKNLGVVTVNGDTTATDLPGLLNAIVPPTDAQLLLFQGILADTEDARDIALLAAAQQTTLELIASTTTHPNSTVLTLSGHTLPGDGGGGKWQLNGVVGQTPSQSPTQLADFLLNDGNGNQWALVDGVVLAFNGVQYLPLPFGATGNGNYAYNNNDFDKIVDPDRLNPATLAIWQDDTSVQAGDAATTAERTVGNGGGATGQVISGTGTANGTNIVAHNTLSLSWALRAENTVTLVQLGVTGDAGGQYTIETSVTAVGFKDFDLGGGFTAVWQSGIQSLTSRKEDVEFKAEDKYFGGQSEIFEGGGVLILGDSNSQGFGSAGAASDSYRTGFAFKLIQSIYNAVDQGQEEDRGFRYGSILSLVSELEDPGVSTDGTLQTSGGAVESFITLAAGESISITGREVTFCDCYYTSASGTLSLEFYLNGVLFDTKVLTPGVGETAVFTTFPTQINTDGTYIKDTDVLKIQAAAGTDVSITGLLTLRTSNANYSPHVVIAAKSGWALNNFNPSLVADNISRHMNLIRGVGAKILVVVALGTNDIYNPTHADTPADYITQLQTLITNYTDKLAGNAEFLIEIPPESGSLFGTATGDHYLEYVSEIINFCETNGHQMIRLDKSTVSDSDTYLFDNGVHFDAIGATIVAKEACRTIGVPYNPYVHKTTVSEPPPAKISITLNDTWIFQGDDVASLSPDGQIVHMQGLANKTGSTSTTIGTLDAAHRPSLARFISVRTDNITAVGLTINTNGTLIIDTLPLNWVAFDDISFLI